MGKSKQKNESADSSLQLLDDLRCVAGTPAGKRLLFAVLSMGNIYSSTFTGNSETFFLEGRRAVALELLSLMNEADPTMYVKILQENGGTDG
jgi:hypothetical protein